MSDLMSFKDIIFSLIGVSVNDIDPNLLFIFGNLFVLIIFIFIFKLLRSLFNL